VVPLKRAIWTIAILLTPAVGAQTSTSFKLEEQLFNAGGNPADGVVLTSTSFRITLDAIGESAARRGLGSDSLGLDGGFVPRYRPPGEVTALRFTDAVTLVWKADGSVGWYNLYRDLMSNLSTLGYGDCDQYDLTTETTTDTDAVPSDDGYFYLVTAKNRLGEEGTKGFDSDDVERPNLIPCP
jgi:hypothetical protein